MADDLAVVNAARVAFGAPRRRAWTTRNAGLVRFLMRERHATPFEHSVFRFHIKAPIFVAREWKRHRVGSYNERSARYSELPDEFYVPAARATCARRSASRAPTRFEPVDDDARRGRRATASTTSYARVLRRLPRR